MLSKEALNKNDFLLKVIDGEGLKKLVMDIESFENNYSDSARISGKKF